MEVCFRYSYENNFINIVLPGILYESGGFDKKGHNICKVL